MADTYSLSEVFRIAEEIERNGFDFYVQAAVAAKDADTKKVFQELAEKEKEHQMVFADMRRQFCAAADTHWFDPDGQASAYLKTLADNHVFNLNQDISALLASVQSSQSALRLAIGFEKDTIAFFTALKNATAEHYREKIDLLIKEELDHIRQLAQALASL